MYEYIHFCFIFFGFLCVLKLYLKKLHYKKDEEILIFDDSSTDEDVPPESTPVPEVEKRDGDVTQSKLDAKKRMSRYNSMMYL